VCVCVLVNECVCVKVCGCVCVCEVTTAFLARVLVKIISILQACIRA